MSHLSTNLSTFSLSFSPEVFPNTNSHYKTNTNFPPIPINYPYLSTPIFFTLNITYHHFLFLINLPTPPTNTTTVLYIYL